MELIDKERVEEILRNLWKEDDGTNPEHRICYNKALQEVQCELDTIEVKEIDLEKEVVNWWNDRYKKLNDDYEFGKYNGHYMENSTVISLVKHFYELGLKVQK